jgi:RHS repeat-associated protein
MTSAVETNSLSVIENSEVYKYDVFGNLTEQDMTPYVGGIPGPTTVLKYAMDDWNPAKAGSLGNSGNDTWAALDGTGLLLTENIDGSGINQHLATVSAGGIVSLLLTDRQESMRGVVDSTGTVTSTVGYDAFGNVISVGTPGEFGYAGYRYDAAPTALYMDNARVYDPASQRWLTQDPDGFDAGDSNLYRYVKNAPTIANDPSGFAEVAAQRISAPAEARGFNLVSGEHLDAGSEFRFSLTNPPAGVPANKISYQLWNNNLKRILKNGFGTSFDFDLPQVAGKFHVIFRDSRNLNGPTPIIVQSPDFVAIKAKVYNFSVRVSNSIPNAVNFAEVEVPRIFRIAQNLLLKKVAGDDFRANVSFKPGGAFVFPANGGGINGSLPDPVTSNAEARRWLTNGTNIAFVDGFPGLNGQNFGPSKAVVRNRGNNDLTAITLAHEIGHGVGLGHVNSQFGLMTGRGTNVDSIIISAAEAKAFDGGP